MRKNTKKKYFHILPVITTNVSRPRDYNLKVYDGEYFYTYNPYDLERDIKILMRSMIRSRSYAIYHWAKSRTIESDKKTILDRMRLGKN